LTNCSVDDCSRPAEARALCSAHYKHWYRRGGVDQVRRLTPGQRFWAQVSVAPGACWLWIGTVGEKGYGRFWLSRRAVQAHRFAYEFTVGPIPDGMQLDHICRTRACVNPEHLEPVTPSENIRRAYRAKRVEALA
jgi:hypothetical protein